MAKLHIITGEEGCRKSTVAALTAVRSARHGKRTLLMGLDPDSCLEDAFQMKIGSRSNHLFEGLTVRRFSLRQSRRSFIPMLNGLGAVSSYLPYSPDPAAMKMLSILSSAVKSGSYDHIYIDAPEFYYLTQLISLPHTIIQYLKLSQQEMLSAGNNRMVKKLESLLLMFEQLLMSLMDPEITEIALSLTNDAQHNAEYFHGILDCLSQSGFQFSRVYIDSCTPADSFAAEMAAAFEDAEIQLLPPSRNPVQGLFKLLPYSKQFCLYRKVETPMSLPIDLEQIYSDAM